MAELVLTIIGDDRPGLVNTLSQVINAHDGNWEESRMSHLANKFAGILLVSVADAKAQSLINALNQLTNENLLHITAELSSDSKDTSDSRELLLDLIGQDRPGIVHDISHALAEQGISIEEFNSETQSASMAGGLLFSANARLSVPNSINTEQLQAVLENLADELMVDIKLAEE